MAYIGSICSMTRKENPDSFYKWRRYVCGATKCADHSCAHATIHHHDQLISEFITGLSIDICVTKRQCPWLFARTRKSILVKRILHRKEKNGKAEKTEMESQGKERKEKKMYMAFYYVAVVIVKDHWHTLTHTHIQTGTNLHFLRSMFPFRFVSFSFWCDYFECKLMFMSPGNNANTVAKNDDLAKAHLLHWQNVYETCIARLSYYTLYNVLNIILIVAIMCWENKYDNYWSYR